MKYVISLISAYGDKFTTYLFADKEEAQKYMDREIIPFIEYNLEWSRSEHDVDPYDQNQFSKLRHDIGELTGDKDMHSHSILIGSVIEGVIAK